MSRENETAQSSPVFRQVDFYRIISTEENCVQFLREKGVLPGGGEGGSGFCKKERNGKPCGGTLKDYMRKNRNGTYSKTLRCNRHGCGTYVSIRKSNKFFTSTDLNGRCSSGLSICQILELCWMWVNSYSIPAVEQLTGRTNHTVVDWYNLCREVCDAMFHLRLPMGGIGEAVHIDEYLCLDKDTRTVDLEVKNGMIPDTENPVKNYGTRTEGPWVFAICLRYQDKVTETRFLIVQDRNPETIIPIIQNEVARGTTIYTDNWSAYEPLSQLGYVHETMKNSKIFTDPSTGKRTKSIDRIWEQIQRKYNIKVNGVNNLSLKLREEWWRSLNPTDTFNAFLRDVRKVYYQDDLEESLVSLLEES